MEIFKKIIAYIKKYNAKVKRYENFERIRKKNRVMESILKPMSVVDVDNWNLDILRETYGNIGGGWTEYNIKMNLFNSNFDLFKEKDYDIISKHLVSIYKKQQNDKLK